MSQPKIAIKKQILVDLYLNQRMSMAKIANFFDVSTVTILKRFREYGIFSRSISQALQGRTPWNKNKKLSEEEKNLIGQRSKVLWQDASFLKKMVIRNKANSERMRSRTNPMKDINVVNKVRPRMSERWLGSKNPMSKPELREKVKGALMGHAVSVKAREKISKNLMGRFGGEKNPFFGKHHAPEVREKSRLRAIKQLSSGSLRNRSTSIELKIEAELLKRSIEHKKQFPLIGMTVVDFYLPQYNIVIYADGEFWHKSKWAEKQGTFQKDEKQNRVLAEKGYKVFRFSESAINQSANKCVSIVIDYIHGKN
ncbi:MAG TPA: NUMOD3 domain-containing DNA-binding protein [Negativicutes bacterium]|nr:NUMOD3 domain-containing DNA-binding protein [Negativicutes bacterium]